MSETWGTCLTLASMVLTVALTAGSVTLAAVGGVEDDLLAVAGDARAAACSRSRASVDSVLGSVKLLE